MTLTFSEPIADITDEVAAASKKVPVWTPGRDEELARLWATKMTAREIANEMGIDSRNKVIGRANRLNLSRKKSALGPPRVRKVRVASRVAPVVAAAKVVSDPSDLRPVGEAAKYFGAPEARPAPVTIAATRPTAESYALDDDANLAHPEYDPETKSWFLPGTRFEAKTLSALQRRVGPKKRFAGYVPMTTGADPIVRSIPPALGVHKVRHAKAIASSKNKINQVPY